MLKVFDIVRTMTGGNYETSVVANGMYFYSFVGNQQGWGSALAVFLMAADTRFQMTQPLRAAVATATDAYSSGPNDPFPGRN